MDGVRSGQARARHADDVRLDDDVVRAADEQEMLDVVAPQQDELALTIEIVDVDDPEAGLAGAAPVLCRDAHTSAGEPAKHHGNEGKQREDDRERYGVLDRRRGVDAES
jgi:hypothetical protein